MRNATLALALMTASFFQCRTPDEGMRLEPSPEPPVQVQHVLAAMAVLAKTEHTTPEKLMAYPEAVARSIVEHAETYKIDPFLLVTIAWTESRFRATAKGDHQEGKPRSCGMTQIRTDFKGRPTCEDLMDPHVALGWTAAHLSTTASQKGYMRLDRYNGGDYEVRIWRKVDWLRREVQHAATV